MEDEYFECDAKYNECTHLATSHRLALSVFHVHHYFLGKVGSTIGSFNGHTLLSFAVV